MNKLVSLLVALMVLILSNKINAQTVIKASNDTTIFSVNQLYLNSEKVFEKAIKLRGIIAHVCKHENKECVVKDENSEKIIRILSSEDKIYFDKLSEGKTGVFSGILKGQKIPGNQIEELYQKSLKEKNNEDKQGVKFQDEERFKSQIKSLINMKNWMKEKKKDYFLSLYVEISDYTL